MDKVAIRKFARYLASQAILAIVILLIAAAAMALLQLMYYGRVRWA